MEYPQPPIQPPVVSATKTGADIQRNERTAAHDRQDELAARGRRARRPGILDRLRALLKRG